MRFRHLAAVAAALGTLLASSALTLPAGAAGAAAPVPVTSPVPSGAGWQCRTSTTRPSADLTATATVCARYHRGSWEGGGRVRLVSDTRTVTGTLTQGVDRVPGDESRWFARPFTVSPGRPLELRLGGREKARARDSRAGWVAIAGVSADGRPNDLPRGPDGLSLVIEGRMHSPFVGRRAAVVRSSRFKGAGANVCATRTIRQGGADPITATAGICLAQQDGTLVVDVPHVVHQGHGSTLTAAVTVFVDGREVASTLQPLLPSRTARADDALGSTSVAVLRGDRAAVVELEIGGTRVRSHQVRLRG